MIVRYNKKDGSGRAYETIDFRETMPAAGNLTVGLCRPVVASWAVGLTDPSSTAPMA